MYVKYKMVGPTDYRGNVALVVSGSSGDDVAYSVVDAMDSDMVKLVDAEVELVMDQLESKSWLPMRSEYQKKLDVVADSVRESYKYPGKQSIDMEYSQVESVLNDWIERGSPVDDVPDEIAVWQEVTGQTLDWVVDDIRMSIDKHRTMISVIRRQRLIGKKAIREVGEADVKKTYDGYVSQLEAMRVNPDY